MPDLSELARMILNLHLANYVPDSIENSGSGCRQSVAGFSERDISNAYQELVDNDYMAIIATTATGNGQQTMYGLTQKAKKLKTVVQS
jgi:hypothetical protein